VLRRDLSAGARIVIEMRIWNPYAMEGVDNGVAVYGSEGMVQIGRWAGKSGFKVFDRKGQEVLFDNANEPDAHARNAKTETIVGAAEANRHLKRQCRKQWAMPIARERFRPARNSISLAPPGNHPGRRTRSSSL